MATINLTKGNRINLQKGVEKFRIGLSWDVSSRGQEFDLDAWAMGLNSKDIDAANIVVKGDSPYFIFYNNLKSFDEALEHTGDNRTGDGAGDDEIIYFTTAKLDSKVQALIFGVTIHDAKARRQNFGQVRNPKVKLYIGDNDVPELVYELDEDYSNDTCVEFCKIYRHNDELKFEALGLGNDNDLEKELIKYHWPTSDIQN